MNNWKSVWDNREDKVNHSSVLGRLIAVDGFDTGFGTISEYDWIQYIDHITKVINITKEDSVFEVGCGAGAFLYKFYEQGNRVGGVDYSEKLINIANKYLVNVDFKACEANQIDEKKKYDYVMSNSVFYYFKSYKYAEEVLKRMVNKSVKCTAILEVSDFAKKEESMAIRKGHLSNQEYDKRYRGLEHLYYEKDWFYHFAEKNNLKIEIQQQNINNYQNNQYRFNVFMWKK